MELFGRNLGPWIWCFDGVALVLGWCSRVFCENSSCRLCGFVNATCVTIYESMMVSQFEPL